MGKKNNEEIYKYLEVFLSDVTTLNNAYDELKKLAIYLKEFNYQICYLNNLRLLSNNKLNDIIKFVVSNNIDKVKSNKLSEIIDDPYIISLVESYAVRENLLDVSEDKNLPAFENYVHDTNLSDDLVNTYISEIAMPLLTVDEERILGHLILRGSIRARNILVERNLRLIFLYMKKSNVEAADLVQQGNIGLIYAAEKFDITKGYRFSTYAKYWCFSFMRKAHIALFHNLRFSEKTYVQFCHILNEFYELAKNIGRYPTKKEFLSYLNMSEEEFDEFYLMTRDFAPVDLDKINDESLIDYNNINFDEIFEKELLRSTINQALESCTERQREILNLYFGFTSSNPLRICQIATLLKITKQAASLSVKNGLKRMKKKGFYEILLPFYDCNNHVRQKIIESKPSKKIAK